MFGDMLGGMEEKQKALKVKLETIEVEGSAGDGAVKVTSNANRKLTNIHIDPTKIDIADQEALEDLILVAANRALELAVEKEAAETEGLLKDILPPGLGGLSNLFG